MMKLQIQKQSKSESRRAIAIELHDLLDGVVSLHDHLSSGGRGGGSGGGGGGGERKWRRFDLVGEAVVESAKRVIPASKPLIFQGFHCRHARRYHVWSARTSSWCYSCCAHFWYFDQIKFTLILITERVNFWMNECMRWWGWLKVSAWWFILYVIIRGERMRNGRKQKTRGSETTCRGRFAFNKPHGFVCLVNTEANRKCNGVPIFWFIDVITITSILSPIFYLTIFTLFSGRLTTLFYQIK